MQLGRLVLLACLATLALAEMRSYAGERVMRVYLRNDEEYHRLNALVERFYLDVWKESKVEQVVDIRIPAHVMPAFQQLELNAEVFIDNLDELVFNQVSKVRRAAGFFEEYHTFEENIAWVDNLVRAYPNIATKLSIGKTVNGLDIWAVRLSGPSPRKGFFFNGGQHAREWITVPTVLGLMEKLATGYNNDSTITNYLNNIEFTIVPILNPDGYSYTWTNDRLWRKNRQTNPGSVCLGTDTNRNWGYQWATGGSSSQPCSDTYHGPSAMSSQEASSVDSYLKSRVSAGVTYHAFIDYHAYSQLFMSPWGYTCNSNTRDHTAQMTVLNNLATAIRNAGYNTRYTVGPVCQTIYQASGGSNDHAYGSLGIKYALAAEGRDTGRYGFLLPEDQIIPSIEENWAGFKVVADAVLAE